MVRLLKSVIALTCALALGVAALALASQSAAAKPKVEGDQGKRESKDGPKRPKSAQCVVQQVDYQPNARERSRKVPVSAACFDTRRDRLWVLDYRRDGHSAIALWEVPYSHRKGFCRNPWGAGTWASCDMSFKFERPHSFYWLAARYEASKKRLLPGRSKIGKEPVR